MELTLIMLLSQTITTKMIVNSTYEGLNESQFKF